MSGYGIHCARVGRHSICHQLFGLRGLTLRFVCTITYLHFVIRFEWDPAKNEANESKHGVDFEAAQLVFDDPCCVTFIERVSSGEERWHAIGSVEEVVIVVVVHTYKVSGEDEVIRIISARAATRHERRLYVQAIG